MVLTAKSSSREEMTYRNENDCWSKMPMHSLFFREAREPSMRYVQQLNSGSRLAFSALCALKRSFLPTFNLFIPQLWEMACARNLGMTSLPIVCVNVDGYYEAFRQMLQRSSTDKLNKLEPDDILHFEPTAERAIRWIENYRGSQQQCPKLKSRKSSLSQDSFSSPPVVEREFSSEDSFDLYSIDEHSDQSSIKLSYPEVKEFAYFGNSCDNTAIVAALMVGVAIGVAFSNIPFPFSV